MLLKPKKKGLLFPGIAPRYAIASVSKGYTFLTGQDYEINSTATSANYSATMTGTAGRLIVFTMNANSVAATSVVYDPTGANVTLTLDYSDPNGFGGVYSGLIPAASGSKVIQVNSANIAFTQNSMGAWLATGLTSGFDAGSYNIAQPSTVLITVNTGDFLFSLGQDGTGPVTNDYTGSTQAPTRSALNISAGGATNTNGVTADWSAPTVGAFTIHWNGALGGSNQMAATYK